MGSFYQRLDRPRFDYDLQRVPGIAAPLFRGPAVDLSRPYIACIGAAQTFGRFVHEPYPMLLSRRLGVQVLNLGAGAASPRLFQAPEYLALINGALLVVIQVMSARSEGNSLFSQFPARGYQGIRFDDGKPMTFVAFMKDLLATQSTEVVERVMSETRSSYVSSMIRLLSLIRPPKVLLWLAMHRPKMGRDEKGWNKFPQLVTEAVIKDVVPHASAYVECASTEGIPQTLWPADEPIDGTTLEEGVLVNAYYPSPQMHLRAAGLLTPVVDTRMPRARAAR